MINYSKEAAIEDAKKQDVVSPVKCDTTCKINTVKYVFIGVGITFLIGFLIAIGVVIYRSKKNISQSIEIICINYCICYYCCRDHIMNYIFINRRFF